MFLKFAIVGVGFVWSTKGIFSVAILAFEFDNCVFFSASVVFMTQVINEERRLLAVYPVFFFYTFIAWLVLLQ